MNNNILNTTSLMKNENMAKVTHVAEEGGEESLLAMIGADPKQLAEAGDLDSPRNSTG